MEPKTAHLRVKHKRIIAEGTGGTIFWATPSRARLLIDAGAVELMNGPRLVGPAETKPAEPLEKKEHGSKKFLAAVPDGRSTASALSNVHGTAARLFASAVGRVSTKAKSGKSSKPEN